MSFQVIATIAISVGALCISVITLLLAFKKASREEVADDKKELRLEIDELRAELKQCLTACGECHAARLRDTTVIDQLTRERVMMLERIAFRVADPGTGKPGSG